MKYAALFIALMQWFSIGHGCAISPLYQIVTEPQRYIEKSNAIFFAKLIKLDNTNKRSQMAEFQVLEIYKGKPDSKIMIINKIETNCSRTFSTVGTNYYIFGNTQAAQDEIVMHGFPGFVPENYAIEMGLPSILQAIK